MAHCTGRGGAAGVWQADDDESAQRILQLLLVERGELVKISRARLGLAGRCGQIGNQCGELAKSVGFTGHAHKLRAQTGVGAQRLQQATQSKEATQCIIAGHKLQLGAA